VPEPAPCHYCGQVVEVDGRKELADHPCPGSAQAPRPPTRAHELARAVLSGAARRADAEELAWMVLTADDFRAIPGKREGG
jgi:hypothetical protein